MTAAQIEAIRAAARRGAESWPALTPEQVERLRRLLAPARTKGGAR